MKTIRILLGLFALLLCGQTIAQHNSIHDKYWYYRWRFKNNFIKIGPNQGESLPAGRRYTNGYSHLRWGDCTTYIGHYLAVLATEARILASNNQTAAYNETIMELHYALEAINRLDFTANSMYPYNGTNAKDGFFVRDDVPDHFVIPPNIAQPSFTGDANYKHFNNPLLNESDIFSWHNGFDNGAWGMKIETIESDYNFTWVGYDEDEDTYPPQAKDMSKDQVFALIFGLAMVDKVFSNSTTDIIFPIDGGAPFNYNIGLESEIIAARIMEYIRSRDGINENWRIKTPHPYNKFVARGSDPVFNKVGVEQSYQQITGFSMPSLSFQTAGLLNPIWSFLWQESQKANFFNSGWTSYVNSLALPVLGQVALTATTAAIFNKDDNRHQQLYLACVSDAWYVSVLGVPTGVKSTKQGIKNHTEEWDWDSLYLMYWKYLHNKSANIDDATDLAFDQLTVAPAIGPYKRSYGYNAGNVGWAASGKFWKDKDKQTKTGDGDDGYWNGLDYMLLHNLYYLTAEDADLPKYENKIDRLPDLTFPVTNGTTTFGSHTSGMYTYGAFNTINVKDVTLNSDARVSFRAGKEIFCKEDDELEVAEGAWWDCEDIRPFRSSMMIGYTPPGPGQSVYGMDPEIFKQPTLNPRLMVDNDDPALLFEEVRKTSTAENLEPNWAIYPNPSTGLFYLTVDGFEKSQQSELILTDVLGKEVAREEVSPYGENDRELNLSHLPKGIYLAQLRIGEKMQVQKLILQ